MPKNTDGSQGPICNHCGGFGYTNSMSGGAAGCPRCQGDGIAPIDIRALAKQVDGLDEKLNQILDKLK